MKIVIFMAKMANFLTKYFSKKWSVTKNFWANCIKMQKLGVVELKMAKKSGLAPKYF